MAWEVIQRWVRRQGRDVSVSEIAQAMKLAHADALRRVRLSMARTVSADSDRAQLLAAWDAVTWARMEALEALPPGAAAEAAQDLETVRQAADATSIDALLDAPFALLFVAATAVLSPWLAVVEIVGMGLVLAAGEKSRRHLAAAAREHREARMESRSLVAASNLGLDTVRAFRGRSFVSRLWQRQSGRVAAARRRMAAVTGISQSASAMASVFVRVGIYAVGAVEVTSGRLTFAALIGASILGSYAVQKVALLTRVRSKIEEANEAAGRLAAVLDIEQERRGGPAPECDGSLKAEGLAFAFPGAEPLFEGLDLEVPPGGALVVTGGNGSGKTTLARLLLGLLAPTGGRILAAGTDLAEWDLEAWRANVLYMPQEPQLFSGTLRENLTMPSPDLSESDLNAIIRTCGLSRFLDTSEKGLETVVRNGGRDLSLGIRRRLALARALAGRGRLAVLDEPTEGLDAEGRRAVYAVMNDLRRGGRTIVAFSHDPAIVKAADIVLDLGPARPRPRVIRTPAAGEVPA